MRLLIVVLLFACSLAQADVMKMASLEWPPYAGSKLPGQGTVISKLRAALASQGHQLQVTFLPWQRALLLVNQDSDYVAYGPEYQDGERDLMFISSDVVGYGPLGIAYRKAHPLVWQRQADLYKYRIGVVRDYLNTALFDNAVEQGLQPVDQADSDRQNLLKLAYGRVDGAVVDLKVMAYWLEHDEKLAPFKEALVASPQLLEKKALYVNFRRGDRGQRWQAILNRGLKALAQAQ